MEKTKVIFRKIKNDYTGDWDIIAFFPETYDRGFMTCYEHIGQHGEACLQTYWATKKAKPEEYADLYRELTELVGYNLRVMQKMTY
jgi:hypothetical protein